MRADGFKNIVVRRKIVINDEQNNEAERTTRCRLLSFSLHNYTLGRRLPARSIHADAAASYLCTHVPLRLIDYFAGTEKSL